MKAYLHNYRQSPRKVALAAGLVRGKTVAQALVSLQFAGKRASSPVSKLIESAAANAKNSGISNPGALFVKEIRVDQGVTLKRIMPRAQGRAARINKRSSHILVVLGEKMDGKAGKAADRKAAKAASAVPAKAAKADKPAAKPKK